MPRLLLILLALPLSPAAAQIPTLVVPAEAAVVIAPRQPISPRPSMVPPRADHRQALALTPHDLPAAPDQLTTPGLGATLGFAAAGALAAMLGGGGGGTAAPTRTR